MSLHIRERCLLLLLVASVLQQTDLQSPKTTCNEADGECICNLGFKKDPNNEYKCNKINCPDRDNTGYCQGQCQFLGCTQGGSGQCVNGECRCNNGFKKDPNNEYECNKIICPDLEHTEYCQGQCPSLGCTQGGSGQCVNGQCRCNNGFKKDPNNEYKCNIIRCPSASKEDDPYCKSQCQPQCNNGECDFKGVCTCYNGFKKDLNSRYKCKKNYCPDLEHTEYCQWQCQSLDCTQGGSGRCVNGQCRCNNGFKKDPNNEYKCNKINCPSASKEDDPYCKSQCQPQCRNGWCDFKGFCICNNGFKKDLITRYKCNKINCPDGDHTEYCHGQCPSLGCTQEGSGQCVNGECKCNNGFTNDPDNHYKCVEIQCPSSSVRNITEQTFCKSICEAQCTNGACDDFGACKCHQGFKERPDEKYKCYKIKCPATDNEDKTYCVSHCNVTCKNGECDDTGVCKCFEGFVSMGNVNENGSCEKYCNSDKYCSPEKPKCSISGYCTNIGGLYSECVEQCITKCQRVCSNKRCATSRECPCENGAENIATCSTVCLRDSCERFREPLPRDDAGDGNWEFTGVANTAATVIVLAIVGGVVYYLRRCRKGRARSRDIPMTDIVQEGSGSTKEPGASSKVPGSLRECESYLEPRRFGQEASADGGQYPDYETVQEVLPNVMAPAVPLEPRPRSYLQLADFSAVSVEGPVYLNLSKEQDEQEAYVNFAADIAI